MIGTVACMEDGVSCSCTLPEIENAGLKAGELIDIHSHFEGEVRKAQDFIIVPYTIPLRCAAAYYPETNVLVPIRSVAAMSNQPAYKCIVVTLHKNDHVAHNVDISSTGVAANLGQTSARPRLITRIVYQHTHSRGRAQRLRLRVGRNCDTRT